MANGRGKGLPREGLGTAVPRLSLAGLLGGEGKGKGKRAACVYLALHPNPAPMFLDDQLDHRQAEAGPTPLPPGHIVGAKELVEYIAKALVAQPDQVEARLMGRDGDAEVIELQVAPEDRGKVIGKRGRTAHAIRTLLNAVSDKDHSYTLEIVD